MPDRLGPYEIVSLPGAGAMGKVYRARDTRLGRDVALKVIVEEVSQDPSRLQRFEREARAVAALNHPNIVSLYTTKLQILCAARRFQAVWLRCRAFAHSRKTI
jgi:serine/threonine protein kinase